MSDTLPGLGRYAASIGSPAGVARCVFGGAPLPAEYTALINVANGFTTRSDAFRFFAFGDGAPDGSLQAWNSSPWKLEYGPLAEKLTFIAEDAFGDQYGYLMDPLSAPRLVKFYVEGGWTEAIRGGLFDFLQEMILVPAPKGFDFHLAESAFKRGLRPGLTEHLAFSLPLICGGEYDVTNLGVESSIMHLSILGQVSLKNRQLPNGARIGGFVER